jgi:hypothetical protein
VNIIECVECVMSVDCETAFKVGVSNGLVVKSWMVETESINLGYIEFPNLPLG